METNKDSFPSGENEPTEPEAFHEPLSSTIDQTLVTGEGTFYQIQRGINWLSEFFGIVAVVVLVFMMLLTVSDVVLRYFFNKPIMASAELTEYMMVIVSFLGIAWCATKGSHIKVDLLVGRWSNKSQAVIDIINAILVLGLAVLIASQSFNESMVAIQMGRASEITDIPHFPFYLVIVLGYVLLFLVMIGILVRSIRKAVNS